MSLRLLVTEAEARNGVRYQCLEIDITGRIDPSVLQHLQLPPALDFSRGVVLWGSAPVWLYGHLLARCASAPWVGCYNVPLGSFVIVASNGPDSPVPGDAFQLVNRHQCSAILIGGPPNSGKSVLCAALDHHLRQALGQKVHLHRAQWDGEGDWYSEMQDRSLADELRRRAKAAASDRFFFYHATAVSSSREVVELVLVDFGGRPQSEDVILLHRCTHYILISGRDDALPEWDRFCRLRGGLKPLAVIHSVREKRVEVLKTDPYLELIAGPWDRGSYWMPEPLIEVVRGIVKPSFLTNISGTHT